MPRGGHKVKAVKPARVDALANPHVPSAVSKPARTYTDWKSSVPTPSFLSRSSSATNSTTSLNSGPVAELDLPIRPLWTDKSETKDCIDPTADSEERSPDVICDKEQSIQQNCIRDVREKLPKTTSTQNMSAQCIEEQDAYEAISDTLETLVIEETQSSAQSSYSKDSRSIYSDSSSIYSSASSINSSGESVHSVDETELSLDSRISLQCQPQPRNLPVRKPEPQDATARERSFLAKKAALFQNSRLSPHLPSFNTSLPTWSMVCRAVQTSEDCYDSQALARRGAYTPADTSNDIKAMIIDDQMIDDTRLIIVSIRGTECKSLSDWAVNKAANPVKPVGFLDDEQNACHAGFLQVTKAMVNQIAAQLLQHSALSENPSLMFTGHSAGGAVAAMLYSHMLSSSVCSELTALASKFCSINCVTFGAPPISVTPLSRRSQGSGVFFAFANEGDPVLRLSNAAYVKSLAKLMAISPPPSATSATAVRPVKIVRRSRGTAVIRQVAPTIPPTPWEDLPMWPTPPAQLTNAGDIILLREKDSGIASASAISSEDLRDVIFGDLAQHTMEVYIRRIKELALAAIMGRDAT